MQSSCRYLRSSFWLGLVCLMLGAVGQAQAATYTVNTTDSTHDGTCDAHCSLEDAITLANGSLGADTIEFAIMPAGGTHVLTRSTELPIITDALVIDGFTQPGSSANTLPFQDVDTVLRIELRASSPTVLAGLRINASNVTIRGLAIVNYFTNIEVSNTSTAVTIAGNFIGTQADGLTAMTSSYGVFVDYGLGVTIGGGAAADRNVISGNTVAGIAMLRDAGSGPVSVSIRGNLIGTDKTAHAVLGNGIGIRIDTLSAIATPTDSIVIGGTGTLQFGMEDANIIAGNASHGIYVRRTAGSDLTGSTLKIQRNSIGADLFLEAQMGNGGDGVRFEGPIQAQVIEGSVRNSGGGGVVVLGPLTPAGRGVLVRNNDIFGNAGPGIDLGNDGHTQNDSTDSDSGPNNLLNFPVITSAVADGVSHAIDVAGTVQAAPSTTYQVDVYNVFNYQTPAGANAWYRIRTTAVTTDLNGAGSFSFSQNNVATPGNHIVAILHDLTNNFSSEIGNALAATASAPSISGWVTLDGNTVMGIAVQLSGSESRLGVTDNNGHYQFDNLTIGGNYTVTPVTYGYSYAPATKSYTNLTVGQRVDFVATAAPATYIVNVAHDQGDGACTVVECTLREAIAEANAHPGADAIHFSIPGAGPHALIVDTHMPSLGSDLLIDGYTQPGAVANTAATGGLNGALRLVLTRGAVSGANVSGLSISGDRVTVRGLVIAGFDTGISIGSMAGPTDIVVAGNYLGTTPDGLAAVAGSGAGISIFRGRTITIGGTTPAARNLISGHVGAGLLSTAGHNGNPLTLTVKGNLIGTDATGLVALGNHTGVGMYSGNTPGELDVVHIGGEAAGEGNVISGNTIGFTAWRVQSDLDGADKRVVGNIIGLGADGTTPLGNAGTGVEICGTDKFLVKRNVIAHNGGDGVTLCGQVTTGGFGVELSENRIFDNDGLAIDLGGNGRTPNDADDPDPGPNGFQNFPVITSAQELLYGTLVTGTLDSIPNRQYRIELFTAGALSAPGMDARKFLVSTTVTADADGIAAFMLHTQTSDPNERFVATATDVTGMQTSEVSDSVGVTPVPTIQVSGTITYNGAPLPNITVNVSGDRTATTQTGADGVYLFNLPEQGTYMVAPESDDYRFTPASEPVSVLAGPTVIDFVARTTTHTRYLTEGAAGPFWSTSVAILNGSLASTTATVEFLKQDGGKETMTVPLTGPGHVVIDTSTIPALDGASFSTLVTSEQRLVASRTMRWGEQGSGGAHAEKALNQPLTDWYFAEGATGCFDLFYLLVNPGGTAAEVDVTFVRRAPETPIVRHYTVAPFSRATVHVNAQEGLGSAEVSARIVVTNGQPIVAERSMYASCFGATWRGGHDAVATEASATEWFFAEGATGSFFDFYLLLANFEAQEANVDVEYLLEDGSTLKKRHVVPANSRVTIDVAGESPLLEAASVSAIVRSKNNVPIVAERSQWWPHGGWYEGHVSAGVAQAGIEWQVAGAQVGGPRKEEPFLLIANTSDDTASVQVRLVFDDGTAAVLGAPVSLAAHSRRTIVLGEAFPQAVDRTFGVIVESLGDVPAPIVVELSTYNDTPGTHGGAPRFWGAGTNVVATRVR